MNSFSFSHILLYFGAGKLINRSLFLLFFSNSGPVSQNFAWTPKKIYKTNFVSGEKLPLKTPLPRSKTQNLTKDSFFLGHPVERDGAKPVGLT